MKTTLLYSSEEHYSSAVQCLVYGDPLTVRETAEEFSIEVSEMGEEHIQRDDTA